MPTAIKNVVETLPTLQESAPRQIESLFRRTSRGLSPMIRGFGRATHLLRRRKSPNLSRRLTQRLLRYFDQSGKTKLFVIPFSYK
jgi:hypothetical protein